MSGAIGFGIGAGDGPCQGGDAQTASVDSATKLPPLRFTLGNSTGPLLTDGRAVVLWELAVLAPTQQKAG